MLLSVTRQTVTLKLSHDSGNLKKKNIKKTPEERLTEMEKARNGKQKQSQKTRVKQGEL
jgi:hypothetical protein